MQRTAHTRTRAARRGPAEPLAASCNGKSPPASANSVEFTRFAIKLVARRAARRRSQRLRPRVVLPVDADQPAAVDLHPAASTARDTEHGGQRGECEPRRAPTRTWCGAGGAPGSSARFEDARGALCVGVHDGRILHREAFERSTRGLQGGGVEALKGGGGGDRLHRRTLLRKVLGRGLLLLPRCEGNASPCLLVHNPLAQPRQHRDAHHTLHAHVARGEMRARVLDERDSRVHERQRRISTQLEEERRLHAIGAFRPYGGTQKAQVGAIDPQRVGAFHPIGLLLGSHLLYQPPARQAYRERTAALVVTGPRRFQLGGEARIHDVLLNLSPDSTDVLSSGLKSAKASRGGVRSPLTRADSAESLHH
eukprot:1490334-Prymnesium_polylepis.2